MESFVDGESFGGFGGKNEISFRFIVLEHLRKILHFASVELRGGYWVEKPVSVGNMSTVVNTYVPDSRQIYWNAVDALADLLYPHFDDEMRKAEEDNTSAIAKRYDEFKNSEKGWESLYKFEKVKLKRKLFRHLCSFLSRKGYLESEVATE